MNNEIDETYDEFPMRHPNHVAQTAAELAFKAAIGDMDKFLIQQADRHDYGTDFQIEARVGHRNR